MSTAGLCLFFLFSAVGLSPAAAQRNPDPGQMTDDEVRESMERMRETGPRMLERMKERDPAMYEKYAPMVQQMQGILSRVDSPEEMRAFLGFMGGMAAVSRAYHDDRPGNEARAEQRFQQATAEMIRLQLLTPRTRRPCCSSRRPQGSAPEGDRKSVV